MSGLALPDKSTFITAAVFAVVAIGVWLVWKNLAGKVLDSDMPKIVILGTGVGGILLAGASLFLSTNFGWSMGGNHYFLPYIFALVFLAISIAEFVSSFWLSYFLQRTNAAFFIISVALMITGVCVSILAGQALIASQVDAQKQERMKASDAYQAAQQQRENAANQVQALAVSKETYQAAQQSIDNALAQAQSLMATNVSRGYSDCSNFPNSLCSIIANYKSRTNELNAQLSPLQQDIKRNQAIIAQYQDYIAAKELANSLSAQPLPEAVKSANLPHIIWLSDLTGIEPNIIEAKLYVGLAIVSELVALVLLFFYGLGTHQNKPKLPIADVTLNEVPAMKVGGYINSDGLVYLHSGEIVLTREQAKQWQAIMQQANSQPASDQSTIVEKAVFQGIDRVPANKSQVKAKGRTGLIDSCIRCGNDYQVKVAHQLNCPQCSHG